MGWMRGWVVIIYMCVCPDMIAGVNGCGWGWMGVGWMGWVDENPHCPLTHLSARMRHRGWTPVSPGG